LTTSGSSTPSSWLFVVEKVGVPDPSPAVFDVAGAAVGAKADGGAG
jgi:hypothetical protein